MDPACYSKFASPSGAIPHTLEVGEIEDDSDLEEPKAKIQDFDCCRFQYIELGVSKEGGKSKRMQCKHCSKVLTTSSVSRLWEHMALFMLCLASCGFVLLTLKKKQKNFWNFFLEK